MANTRVTMGKRIFRLIILLVVVFLLLWWVSIILLWSVQEILGLGIFSFNRALAFGSLTWLYMLARLWSKFQASKQIRKEM